MVEIDSVLFLDLMRIEPCQREIVLILLLTCLFSQKKVFALEQAVGINPMVFSFELFVGVKTLNESKLHENSQLFTICKLLKVSSHEIDLLHL